MKRLSVPILVILALIGGLIAFAPASAAPKSDRLDVYVGDLSAGQLSELIELGVDRQDLEIARIPGERGAKASSG